MTCENSKKCPRNGMIEMCKRGNGMKSDIRMQNAEEKSREVQENGIRREEQMQFVI